MRHLLRLTTSSLICSDSGHYGDRKIRIQVFLLKNLLFNLFLTQNTIKTVISLFMTSTNRPKNQNQPELIYVFTKFKGGKKSNMNSPH